MHRHPELEEKRLDLYSISENEEYPAWSRHSASFPEYYDHRGVQLLGKLAEWAMPTEAEMNSLRTAITRYGNATFETDEGKGGARTQLVLAKNRLAPESSNIRGLDGLQRLHAGVLEVMPRKLTEFEFVISLLHSPKGSKEIQLPHRDLDELRDGEGNTIRAVDPAATFLLLVALENNTTLLVYFGSHLDNNRVKIPHRILLSRGDVLRFHPRIVHCGDRYLESNTRLHYYIMPKGFDLEDETHFPEPEEIKLLGDEKNSEAILENEKKRLAALAAKKAKKLVVNAKLASNAKIGRAKKAAKRLAASTDIPRYPEPVVGEYSEGVSETSVIEEASPAQVPELEALPVPDDEVVVPAAEPGVGTAIAADEEDIGVTYAEEGPGWVNEKWWIFRRNYYTRSKKIKLEY